ncbi:DUF624 domain-containing protein [Fundicoccus sp. Sow4_H7]|uniref:DUF624 domain-containing protein n=1 Tax=Fundicoccus sp. Sow4_H7 TaxID=3438784 RepID=UPI003F909242
MRNKNNRLIIIITKVGEWIFNLFILHFLFFLYSFRGLFLFGIFPSFAAQVVVLNKWLRKSEDSFNMYHCYRNSWHKYFSLSNKLGYTFLLVYIFLVFDLRINEQFINSIAIHYILLLLIVLTTFIVFFSFITMIRGQYGYFDTVKQSFYISLSVPIYTVATSVGLLLMFELLTTFIFLAVFFGIPMMLLPIVWFTTEGIDKAISRKELQKN